MVVVAIIVVVVAAVVAVVVVVVVGRQNGPGRETFPSGHSGFANILNSAEIESQIWAGRRLCVNTEPQKRKGLRNGTEVLKIERQKRKSLKSRRPNGPGVRRDPVAAADLLQIRRAAENGYPDVGRAAFVSEIGRPKTQKSKQWARNLKKERRNRKSLKNGRRNGPGRRTCPSGRSRFATNTCTPENGEPNLSWAMPMRKNGRPKPQNSQK